MSKKWANLSLNETSERLAAWDGMLLDIVKSLSLPESQYKKLEGHYSAIAELLKDPVDRELSDFQIFPQGSVSTRTLVRPLPGCDADVDAIAFRPQGTRLSPRDWLDRLLAELKERARTKGTVTRKKRCVTVAYADKDLPAHVDVTPASPTPGNVKGDGTGFLEVPDYPSNRPHPANPRDFAQWVLDVAKEDLPLTWDERRLVEAKAEAEPMPDHSDMIALDPLRLAIKLAKRHRDVYARVNNCEDVQPLSVILTVLIGKAYTSVARSLRFAHREVTAIEALRLIAARIPYEFDAVAPDPWLLRNPRRAHENFCEKWLAEPRYAQTFFAWHAEFVRAIELGLRDFGTRADFEEAIEEAFGVEPRRTTARLLTEAAKKSAPMPGLRSDVAQTAYNAERAVATLTGLAATTPTRAQEPPGLNKLG